MQITPENVLSVEHAAWLDHPVTQQMLKNLQKHKQQFIESSSKQAGNLTVPVEQFRLNAYGLATLEGAETWIKDTTKFVSISERK